MTQNTQRIAIAIIAIVMVVGTIGSYAMIVLSNENAIKDQNKESEAQQKLMEEEQKKDEALSEKYYPVLKEYEKTPSPFNAEEVGETVTHIDLKEGDGPVITGDSIYKAYYIGWNPKGEVFDGSIMGDRLKPPLDVSPGFLIQGWYDGVEGMKIGGVREITIPSDLAYGDQDRSDSGIPPNTPLKFIILAIEE